MRILDSLKIQPGLDKLPKIYYIFNLQKVMWTVLLLLVFIFGPGFLKGLLGILEQSLWWQSLPIPATAPSLFFFASFRDFVVISPLLLGCVSMCVECPWFMICKFCNLWDLDEDGKCRNLPRNRICPKLFWENTQGIKIYIFN